MGLLDGQIAAAIYAGFKGKLLRGVIRVTSPVTSGGLDNYGDVAAQDVTSTTCQGFTDRYSAAFRATAGIPETDLRVCIFAKSIPGITPSKDDKVGFDRDGVRTWYQLRRVDTDPAEALWECQGFEIPDPDA